MLINLIQNLPNLIRLKLETFDIYCDGHEWEKILIKYLPYIQQFHLKMNLMFPNNEDIDQQAYELLDTFRTSFWLLEHRWFVRCDWDPMNLFNHGVIYTLPYTFDDCFYFDAVSSKSTCPTITDHWLYDRVPVLSHKNPENDQSKDLILFLAKFPNLRHLKISLPFDRKFLSCILSYDRLRSINITFLSTDFAYMQLQDLLNRTLHLYSLKLSHMKSLSMKFFTLKSSSIRKIDLIANCKSPIRYFNKAECFLIIRAPIIRQCEVLLIGIKERSNIIEIVNTIPNLRAFIFQCEDDEYNMWNCAVTNDEFLEWLREHLPSKYLISRDEKQPNLIRLWIDRLKIR